MAVEVARGRSSATRRRLNKSAASAGEFRCPTCGSSLSSRRVLEEIQARLAAEENARAERAKREAQKAAEVQLRALRASQEEIITQRVSAARETLVKEAAELINAEKVKAFEETTRLSQQLAEMQRRVERRTPHELGEPAEVDLFGQLQASLPDRVSRIARGKAGPDVVIEVVQGGGDVVAGSIVIDCKNHKRWANAFVTKLKSDQRMMGAAFAILSTSTFPKGARQLHIQDGVIVADPARVIVLVHLLRRLIIENHSLKLGSEARDEKAARLLDFVMSPLCNDLLDRMVRLTDELMALDHRETEAHAATWKKRGELIRAVRDQGDQIADAFSRITQGSKASP